MKKCMTETMMKTMNVDTTTGAATNMMIVSITKTTNMRVVIG